MSGQIASVGQQPKTNQCKFGSCLKTSTNNIIRCLKEGLVEPFIKDRKHGGHNQVKIQGSYKCARTVSSNVWHNDFHKNVSLFIFF